MSNDNKKGAKIPKPAPAEEVEILQAINISLLVEKPAPAPEKEDKPV